MTTVDGVFRERLAAEPDTPFVTCGGQWLTFAELDERTDRLATGLSRLGVRRGDHIASIMPNRIETVELLLAVAKLGAVQVPLNYFLKGDFLGYQLSDCGAKYLIADGPGYDAAAGLLGGTSIAETVQVDAGAGGTVAYPELFAERSTFAPASRPSDLLTIMYTSGTTAVAKGCMLSTGYFVAVGRAYGMRNWVVPGDRVYTGFPMFHTSGQMVAFMSALVNGASIGIAPEFHASSFMREAADLGATMLVGVGVMANMILEQPPRPDDGAHPFRLASWVPLPEERQREFEERFHTPVMSEGYGQTECVPVTNSDPYGTRERSSSGQVSPLLEARIVDEDDNEVPAGEPGEIVVRPKVANAMYSGYWNKPDSSVEAWRNLWHHTGDFGRMDEDGIITFVDRKKDVLRRRGENVSSLALEAVIRQHPAIADAAVCALPATIGDDDIKASVVLEAGATLTAHEFFDFIRDRVPYFAVPRYVDVREALPVNALGRVMKHVLRDEGVKAGTWDLDGMGLVVPRAQRRGVSTAK
ncbi:AMP-binding protein [Phytohabitans houttuyneae]|uniref:ATP-dependent acyl-CoA ligase n=1 Tax=Phytohabitans houttuyneae TaxID=1076126 RepID=A0A6V8KAY0_9ACTN|nr:AMP-binding protein [Phytohabitans houttuyneae]GFJ82392.1 ATP-dependent acyl-CoA ligase [Phytohabitans houttuyneae]